MLIDTVLFYVLAALILGGAVMTITRHNVVHSAVWLICTLIGVAGIFLLQGAEFLAGVQIIVYIGGIMVLFLFVIMLVNLYQLRDDGHLFGGSQNAKVGGPGAAWPVRSRLLVFIWQLSGRRRSRPPRCRTEPIGLRDRRRRGDGQLRGRRRGSSTRDYLLPFEVASVLPAGGDDGRHCHPRRPAPARPSNCGLQQSWAWTSPPPTTSC